MTKDFIHDENLTRISFPDLNYRIDFLQSKISWVWGYWINGVEHRLPPAVGLILLGILLDLALYWLVLTVIFQEEWYFWFHYLMDATVVFSAMIYQSFHSKDKDIANNRMWVVFKAFLSMFFAFINLVVVAVIIALAAAGVDDGFDFTDLTFSRFGHKTRKKSKLPIPDVIGIPKCV